MRRHLLWFAILPMVLASETASAQYPVLDAVAGKVIQKYQGSSCEQLWQEKAEQQGRPRPPREEQAVQLLRNDPQMRALFIDKVAAPVANKMFECGMLP
jgi:hypothetical protein